MSISVLVTQQLSLYNRYKPISRIHNNYRLYLRYRYVIQSEK